MDDTGAALPTVFVVDDESNVTRAIEGFARLKGLQSETYYTAESFLESFDPGRPGCLVLDYKLPGKDGRQLQDELLARGCKLPIIMISGHGTIELAVEAMQNGAVTFLQKPFMLDQLWQAIQKCLQQNAHWRRDAESAAAARAGIRTLTAKEREVLELLVAGETEPAIAERLGVNLRAVKAHVTRIKKKLNAENLDQLLQIHQSASRIP